MDEEIQDVLQDTPTPDDSDVLLEVPVDQEPEQQPDAQSDLERKNKELYARAKKAEEELKAMKASPKQEQEPSQTNANPDIDNRLARIELATKGYSDEEIDFLMTVGGKEALKNEFVATAIESRRAKLEAQRKSEEATPGITGKSPVYKRHTADELRGMSLEELEKILPKAS